MTEISFKQADIDTNNDRIKKIDEEIENLKRKKRKYQEKNKELETYPD